MEVICISIGIVVFIVICGIYNTLISKRNKVLEAAAGIDVQLKKRFDLLPNLVNIASKYMEHEKEVLEKIVSLRKEAIKSVDLEKKLALDEKISGLLVTFENYPDLKANTTMLNLMRTNSEIEEHIAAARRFFNSAVLDFNNAVSVFPNSFFAKIFNIEATNFFSASENEKRPIEIRR